MTRIDVPPSGCLLHSKNVHVNRMNHLPNPVDLAVTLR
ncbi:hypothetical protein RISK_006324 [Rhodopirellula islandica]|uniref:Uncharacterized protein n=1 Tax=Rhodopirellula islandica TaxID=595434 RepID=A0A0J1B4R5_RHOIS|nr:hypothetical protein RISK_006324 [Rhodopirellula islandica]